ncbi:threonine/serine ThrE exporter family protein [Mobilicoccus pelagius]|uniref:Putative threonine export protein n=1 Tax=Mobilicoccus pelagius NBRC 104925 TaxID=1089455 RepID=H5URP6_9MICO|nr:threonine/serine exporter family protein [Mobilicoccus pelagius]GAB48404.1 putative threonine export protein [Mobilicoccus pelagius NBRC 104925]
MTEEFPAAPPTSKPHVNPELVGVTDDPPSQVFAVVDEALLDSAVKDTATSKPFQRVPQASSILRIAKNAVRAADAPTWGLDLSEIEGGIEKARSRTVIDLAMRIAESTLSTGASAADVTSYVLAVTAAYGLRSVHVDVTFTSIAVTHHRGAFEDPVTMIRIVRTRVPDYERLAATHELISEITDDALPLEEAQERFVQIMKRPHMYRRGVITFSFLLLGGGVAALMGGHLYEILFATVISGVVDRAMLWAGRRRLATFFGQMLGGAIPTAVAMAIVAAQGHGMPFALAMRPSVLVATGIVVLLAGLSVVGAAQDAIDGYYVTAGARAFEVFTLTLGILVGVLSAITVASWLGVPAYLIPKSALATSFAVQLVAVGIIALSFGIGCYAGSRTIIVSVLMAVLGWVVYVALLRSGLGPIPSTAFACLAVGLFSQPAAWIAKVPSLAISTSGIVAFLPGGMVYRGLYYIVEPAPVTTPETDGGFLLFSAGATGLAIAGGVSLGSYFGRQLARSGRGGQGRAKEYALRRSTAAAE